MKLVDFKYQLLGLIEKKINHPILVIESDDWGSLRMPSDEIYANLKDANVNLGLPGEEYYNQYDTLESSEDINALFNLLVDFTDINERTVNFTPLFLMANPNFQEIRDSNFTEYSYLNLKQSYDFWNKGSVIDLIRKGIDLGFFLPQFHGREHLNVDVWMRALQQNHDVARLAFDSHVWSHINDHNFGIFYQAAFDLESKADLKSQAHILDSGLTMFKQNFGYQASYFVPPNGPLSNYHLELLSTRGIRLISSDLIQKEPVGHGKFTRNLHFSGVKNKFGQKYVRRNCFFEPVAGNKDWVDSCLYQISKAIEYKRPAIVSTHRVNYMGGLDVRNRDHGLKELKRLLTAVLKNWPDIQFKTTSDLYDLF